MRDGYANGVPMGGELEDIGEAPSFLISALKDPDGANLDRVQVVKGWLDSAGDLNERVYDVVWSDMEGRRLFRGNIPSVGDTVDRATATYTNEIGSAELRTTWKDPDYIQGQRAYYLRVIEIPTLDGYYMMQCALELSCLRMHCKVQSLKKEHTLPLFG